MGPLLISTLFAACFGLLAWALTSALQQGSEGYSKVYAEEASLAFEDIFLFIPANRIADLARILAVTTFITFFLLFGDFQAPKGWLTGILFGAIGAAGALNLPRIILNFLKRRRLEKFNEQLTDALMTMSNALRAGFSIQQSFESVGQQELNPISQEFSHLLQQTRLGVRFEDAMTNLEERVGSEDLTLMIRAIETARLTGGNLTEVFEQIAGTIRERLRIEGRIKSLTAMGRMQAIVVGFIPLGILFAMMTIDPVMMKGFIGSGTGLALIGCALILEVTGALVIQKMVTIDV
jgi:tight adherence protein B